MENTGRRSLIDSVWRLFVSSAQLARKKADLWALQNISLTKLYYAIGKTLVRLDTLPADLSSRREAIERLSASMRTAPAPSHVEQPSGVFAKATRVAQKAVRAVSTAINQIAAAASTHAAYLGLGKEAVQLHGHSIVPADLQRVRLCTEERIKALNEEIVNLRNSPSAGIVNPFHVLLAIGTLAGLAVLLFVLRTAGGLVYSGQNGEVANAHTSIDVLENSPLSAHQARQLVERTGGSNTRLSVVATALTEDAATVLAGYEGNLSLSLGNLSAGVADRLAASRSKMMVIEITHVVPESATKPFDNFGGSLVLKTPNYEARKLVVEATRGRNGSTARRDLPSAQSGREPLSRDSLEASHRSVESDPLQAGARVTADATHQAWNTFFDTMLNAPPRRDGEPESLSMSRDLVRISQTSLANVDPELSRLISGLIDLQKERIGICRKHEAEIMACDREWASRFAEMDKAGGMAAAQARSPQEAQQTMLATSLLGNGYLTQQRNEAVSAMNGRWAEIYSQYDKRSAEIFDQLEALGPKLETRYQRRFLFP